MPVKPETDPYYRLRHSAAHVMAQAVLELFPEGKIAIGPPIEDGFYYDFDLPRPLTPDDLEEIEKRMRRIIAGKHPFVYRVVDPDEARALFRDQPYKLELIDGLLHGQDEYGEQGSTNTVISTYRHDTFEDLCRGPHLEHTGQIPPDAFKLMSVAGAYWRGDSNRPMLQRIYGTAWNSKEELDAYLHRLEEAKRRDHRRIGKELGLFYFSEDIGPGLPLFTPKGEMLRHLMESYVREVQTRYGYQHVWTGHIVKETLYKKSGHYEAYRENMFPPMIEDEEHVYRLKPMNCPSHMTLYKEMGIHSYRDLPLRFAEFATLYRYEERGTLTGLTRVRALTQDDCHIFCRPDQIEEEFGLALRLIREVLETYRFTNYRVRLSLRGEGGKYIADDEAWDLAERALRTALDHYSVQYEEAPGEAAIYGPKADFLAHDVLGREWQLSTIQVDFIQPRRLGLEYIAEDGQPRTPVVLHRAVTGTTERFMGVLIEHFAGAFPLWLAPVQAVVIPISDERHGAYAADVGRQLTAAGLRVEVDLSRERMQAKIRQAQLQKIPYMLIIGDREQHAGAVAVRCRSGEDLGAVPVAAFIARARAEIEAKA
ncbi:threonine--tRNA ligase [Roseiflexus castenholzii]|uniref:Threonine--tRNA ligase n=1 Tax=Roseiflexus castenholzii (strain DSM 13941 / HLO8) TaxID=383372 RepID=A7NG94_ROSCS|nr:threonine--tRNA ligase [Roseiflexus castenholzii]ABU56481.1 threonyl-tRNA synthetase [Roseiflexus castenholzii DSM 13941]